MCRVVRFRAGYAGCRIPESFQRRFLAIPGTRAPWCGIHWMDQGVAMREARIYHIVFPRDIIGKMALLQG